MSAGYPRTASQGAQRTMSGTGEASAGAFGLTSPDPLYFMPDRAEAGLYESAASNPFAMGLAELMRARRLGSEGSYGEALQNQNAIASELANRRMGLEAASHMVPLLQGNAMPGGAQLYASSLPQGMIPERAMAGPNTGIVQGNLQTMLNAHNAGQMAGAMHAASGAGATPDTLPSMATGDLSHLAFDVPPAVQGAQLSAGARMATQGGVTERTTTLDPNTLTTSQTTRRVPGTVTQGTTASPSVTPSTHTPTVTRAIVEEGIRRFGAGSITISPDGSTATRNGVTYRIVG